eukprot:g3022.t1
MPKLTAEEIVEKQAEMDAKIAALKAEIAEMGITGPDFEELAGFDVDDITEEDLPKPGDPTKTAVIVDGLPAIPKSKLEKLSKVVHKLFSKFGELDLEDIYMPMKEDGSTTEGFAIVHYSKEKAAKLARLNGHNKKFDKKHTLSVFPFSDLERLMSVKDEYVELPKTEYKSRDDLFEWLMDGRDQFVTRQDKNTGVYWIEGPRGVEPTLDYGGERELKQNKNWCEMYVEWSPQGTYLATFHPQGIILWGGPTWRRVQRFAHSGVWKLQFSPCENYLVTWDGNEEEGQKTVNIWDVRSGKLCRAFTYQSAEHGAWPCFKWSHDDTMVGRKGKDRISVYRAPNFELLDKRSIKAPGIAEFSWSPCGYNTKLGGISATAETPVLSYWSPEVENSPAVVRLLLMPERKELRSKNLFNVNNCQIHWQKRGMYMCVQVQRHTKSKKTTYTNFEIFCMESAHKSVAVYHLEQKQRVVAFAWEPAGTRFAYIYGDGAQRLNVDFYTMNSSSSKGKMEKLYTLDNKQCNRLYWSPMGNFIVLAGLDNINGQLEFWDTDAKQSMSCQEHFMCNLVTWDPSGRVLCTAVVQPMFGAASMRYQLENGFHLWTFQGAPMYNMQKSKFYEFSWRPRTDLLLSVEEQASVRKNLKKFISKYEEADRLAKEVRIQAREQERRSKLQKWMDAAAKRKARFQEFDRARREQQLVIENDDEYDIIVEDVETVISTQSEIIA